MKHIFLSFLSVLLYALTYAQLGTSDPSFGEKGKVLTTGFETALGVQKNGRIVISSQGKYKSFNTFKLTCLLPDGSLDTSFGEGGSAFVLIPGAKDTVNDYAFIDALTITKEGKIVAAGSSFGPNFKGATAIARFLPNGSPDSSFGTNGALSTSFDFEVISTVVTQEDGKIIIGGKSSKGSVGNDFTFHSFVARYNENGSIDKSFGDGGIVINTKGYEIKSLAVQPDGNIVAGGYSGLGPLTSGNRGFLERLTPSGQLDETFGLAGIVNDGSASELFGIALQPDGRIVAAGYVDGNMGQIWTVLRYTANGVPDPSFGSGGKVTTSFPNASSSSVQAVFVSGNHIVAAGTTADLVVGNIALAGYNTDGSPDKGFGDNGTTIISPDAENSISAAAVQPDGKILVLGVAYSANESTFTGVLLRYNGYPQQVPLAVRIRRWLQNHGISWKGLPVEDKIAYYSVEQSADGKDFTQIARVSGAANLNEYSLTNSRLLEGANYYRIKAVSTDGEVRYSEVASADNTANTASVFPNPARSFITVQGLNTSEKATIAIKDAGGTVLARGVSGGSTQYRSSVGNLRPGTYYLNITTKNKTETLKFVKE